MYGQIARSNWLIFALLVLALALGAPRFFENTHDSSQYAYHPPFGSIQTGIALGEDPSHLGKIDPLGGLKMAAGFLIIPSIYFLPSLLALFAIRGLLRVSGKSNWAILVFGSNILILLLTLLVGLIIVSMLWSLLQLALAIGGF